MIDVHAHLEQEEFDMDRAEVIKQCRQELKGVITCCAHPKHWGKTLDFIEPHTDFLFLTAGLHPIYVPKLSKTQENQYMETLRENKDLLNGIGECGLDYKVAKDDAERKQQKKAFKRQITLADNVDLPLVIHARRAFKPAVEILEQHTADTVVMHFFSAEHLLDRIIDNGWYITSNNTVLWSESMQHIARQTPLKRILLGTDSPWLGGSKRNTPLAIRKVAEKIAEVKNIGVDTVWRQCGENAVNVFDLPLDLE